MTARVIYGKAPLPLPVYVDANLIMSLHYDGEPPCLAGMQEALSILQQLSGDPNSPNVTVETFLEKASVECLEVAWGLEAIGARGYGAGSGYGDGSGYGYGYGYGNGYGAGSGYGDGSGYGSTYGSIYGDGDGYGSGYDDGSGSGSGDRLVVNGS